MSSECALASRFGQSKRVAGMQIEFVHQKPAISMRVGAHAPFQGPGASAAISGFREIRFLAT